MALANRRGAAGGARGGALLLRPVFRMEGGDRAALAIDAAGVRGALRVHRVAAGAGGRVLVLLCGGAARGHAAESRDAGRVDDLLGLPAAGAVVRLRPGDLARAAVLHDYARGVLGVLDVSGGGLRDGVVAVGRG